MLNSDLLNGAKAAAAYIGETPRAVYHMAEKGLLPCIKKGRKLYFRKSELEDAFRSTTSMHSTLRDGNAGAAGHSTLHNQQAA